MNTRTNKRKTKIAVVISYRFLLEKKVCVINLRNKGKNCLLAFLFTVCYSCSWNQHAMGNRISLREL